MFPLRSAVGVMLRRTPNFLNCTLNWFWVTIRIGTSPPARNSAFSPLAARRRGWARTRTLLSSKTAVAEKWVVAERVAAIDWVVPPGIAWATWYVIPDPVEAKVVGNLTPTLRSAP